MNLSHSPTVPVAQPMPQAPAWEVKDLFAYSGQAGVPVRRSFEVPSALEETVAKFSHLRGLKSDTVWLAAWLLLLRQWRGADCSTWRERPVGQIGPLTFTDLAAATIRASSWLPALDDLRRTVSVEATLQVDFDAVEWLGTDGPTDRARSAAVISVGLQTLPAAAGGEASLQFVIETAVCEDYLATSIFKCVVHAVEQLVSRADPRLVDVHTISVDQAHRQLVDWLPRLDGKPRLDNVVSTFSARAARSGAAIALRHGNEQLDYAQLDGRSSLFAAALRQAGVEPGHAVCVALERGIASIVVLLGILKAGASYLPVDLRFPSERLAFMLDDAQASLVVTSHAHRAAFASAVQIIAIDGFAWDAVAEPHAAPPLHGDDIACLMYTSGSTGVPKGIAVRHDSILRLTIDAAYVALTPATRFLHAAPLGFDASTLEIWGPLLNGGCCVLHDEDLPTGAGLARTIQRHGVTTAWLTAALFNAVVDDSPAHLHGLKQLFIGGEALSVAHVRRALAALPALQLVNGYGPTECTTFATTYRIPHDIAADARSVPIGKPITDTGILVLGTGMQPLPVGMVGDLWIGGRGLARGYLRRPELTAERFVPNPFGAPGERLYRTGDKARFLADGNVEFLGRADGQVKLRGFRIELGEVESALAGHPAVAACAARIVVDTAGHAQLVSYLVARPDAGASGRPAIAQLRAHMATRVPEYMVPTVFMWLDALPITRNGKLDRAALPVPAPERPELATAYVKPAGEIERRICETFEALLGLDRVGRNDNFFDLGGNSLLVLRALQQMAREGIGELTTTAFFRQPTAAALASELDPARRERGLDPARATHAPASSIDHEPIAIVGMAGRFPGARDVEQFWDNLCAGRDSIRVFRDDELDPSVPAATTGDPLYVKARGVIDDVEMFDAAFFGISGREAEIMDPQQRLFLELCWEALERSGHAPDAMARPVGVFAGMYNATYYQRHVRHYPELIEKVGEFQVMLANEKDYIATRIAWRLNLTGPAISVHTACSTSLVAIAQAFASLRAGQCDMALAGGASITCPPRSGYLYQEGSMLSPDGRTRSFDANAQGTVFSDGAAVVVLKRLSDAIADGNPVIALIRGVSINNDGRDKASFTAPSVDGQAAVIAAAQREAGVDARSISYIEAHGTATPMGDPVEIEGLRRAFAASTRNEGFCRIGSLKSNVGHLVIAAGAASVIKTALSLADEKLPASINFDAPNPKIAFDGGPFVVNNELTPWPRGDRPRRAGVSGFGVGGTNAHVVMEEAPFRDASSAAAGEQLLMLSARSSSALAAMAAGLADFIQADPAINLADIAHTLQFGRSRFPYRMAVAADSRERAIAALRHRDDAQRASGQVAAALPELVWLFAGQGAQYAGMGAGLHEHDAAFGAALDECLAAFAPWLAFDLRERMFAGDAAGLEPTGVAQPAIFSHEYALAQAWLAKGVAPALLIGHSVGEFVAAVLAGVMSLADAARLIARRGALMQALPGGSMLSVRLSADELLPMLPAGLALAAENAPRACVVAGPTVAAQAFGAALESRGIATRLLPTSHAFHSPMMDAAVAPFEAEVRLVSLRPPTIPIVSTLTGKLLSDSEATDASYWARHLREPVRFSVALRVALRRPDIALLDVGPRGTLAGLVRQHAVAGQAALMVVASGGDAPDNEAARFTVARGALWTLGLEPTAPVARPASQRLRLRLPTYPFERKRFWLDAPAAASGAGQADVVAAPKKATAFAEPAETSLQPSLVSPKTHKPMITNAMPLPRTNQLIDRLKVAFEDVTGVDLSDADSATSFVELGLDSLALTQAALQVKKQFSVPLTFRQLMETLRSLDALAAYLDEKMPRDAEPSALPEPILQAPAVTVAAASGPALQLGQMPMSAPVQLASSDSFLQQLVQQQMQLMGQQLALLGAGIGAPALAVPAEAVASTPAVAAEVTAPLIARNVPQASAVMPPATTPGDDAPQAPGPIRYDVKTAFGAIARIHTQSQALSDRQGARLDAFMRRYVERTRSSKAYTVANRNQLADPRVVNGFRPMTKEITYQIVIDKSKGSRMWDIDGNEYVDVLNGFGMNLFGWQPDFILDAVRKQLDLGFEIGPQHPLAGEVASLVCELTGFDRAALCNTGSEAVMAAVRIARTVTGRSTIVLFTGSYHGTFDEVLVRAGRNAKGIPAAPGILPGAFGDVRVLEYGTPESLEFIRANADDLAAVLCEPVQSRRPDFRPVSFLKELREITSKSGSCLIFDEVITGFRSHIGGAQALFGVRADLATYGKVIGGGFPVGVIAGTRDFMDSLDGGDWQYGDDSVPTVGVTYFAGTFVRHPLALAAAKASLEHLKQHGNALQTELNTTTTALADELSAFCREVGAPIEIRHFASLWRVSWLEDHPLQDLLYAMMRNRGIHILDNFPCFLTTAHTEADIRLIVEAFKESVRELQESEFLPRHKVALTMVFDASRPPVPGARLGKDREGKPAWFIPNPQDPAKFMKVTA